MAFRTILGLVLAGITVAAGLVALATVDVSSDADGVVVTHVVDGDTVEIESGKHVRLIGIDTPERGSCGFDAATKAMRRLVEDRVVTLINPGSVQDLDAYDRLLRYVEVEETDVGLDQIWTGHAVARYDSRDGYDPHPREARYRQADEAGELICQR